jgi:hypothetical protein
MNSLSLSRERGNIMMMGDGLEDVVMESNNKLHILISLEVT